MLCYLYGPDATGDGGDYGDGTRILTHRTTRACFPMIPVAPAKMQSFREAYQLGGVDFDELEYRDACHSGAVEGVLGSLGAFWARNIVTMAPYGAMLRLAEGVDALDNLARSETGTTGVERAAAIACGVAQLGGLLFLASTVLVCAVLCICAPCGGTCAMMCYRRHLVRRAKESANNDRATKVLRRAEAFLDERDAAKRAETPGGPERAASYPDADKTRKPAELQPLIVKD